MLVWRQRGTKGIRDKGNLMGQRDPIYGTIGILMGQRDPYGPGLESARK